MSQKDWGNVQPVMTNKSHQQVQTARHQRSVKHSYKSPSSTLLCKLQIDCTINAPVRSTCTSESTLKYKKKPHALLNSPECHTWLSPTYDMIKLEITFLWSWMDTDMPLLCSFMELIDVLLKISEEVWTTLKCPLTWYAVPVDSNYQRRNNL